MILLYLDKHKDSKYFYVKFSNVEARNDAIIKFPICKNRTRLSRKYNLKNVTFVLLPINWYLFSLSVLHLADLFFFLLRHRGERGFAVELLLFSRRYTFVWTPFNGPTFTSTHLHRSDVRTTRIHVNLFANYLALLVRATSKGKLLTEQLNTLQISETVIEPVILYLSGTMFSTTTWQYK